MKTPAPGPYEVAIVIDEEGKARGRNGERWVLIKNADGAIASVYPGRDAEATADLLAASYELLGALREARDFIDAQLDVLRNSYLPEPTEDEAQELTETRELLDNCNYAIVRATEGISAPPGRTDRGRTKPEDPTEARRKGRHQFVPMVGADYENCSECGGKLNNGEHL